MFKEVKQVTKKVKNSKLINLVRVNSCNFNATILKFFEKLDHPFSHVFIFGNMFFESHGFVAVPVIRSNNFVLLVRNKLERVSLIQLVTGTATKL